MVYRNFYRDQRDLFTIYMGITYLLQLVDAYVDAHLFDFTVQENYQFGLPLIRFQSQILINYIEFNLNLKIVPYTIKC